jgi:hypothetical protein
MCFSYASTIDVSSGQFSGIAHLNERAHSPREGNAVVMRGASSG